ncbi:PIN domain-containing protein [Winogradskyella maritima]|nr:PIN domain-containing protein [Winogradskyella maritima]
MEYHIFDEWESVMKRKGVSEEIAKKRANMANLAFPDAFVSNYEPLIETLTLPDLKDRHVMAAAIKTNANVIVTNNLKDFPEKYLATFGLSVKSADDLLPI